MAIERNPNTPYDPDRLNDPTRADIGANDGRSPAEFDNELQVDPELAEGPASNARIALFALGVAIVLGAVFYGLNHSSMQQASTSPAPANSQNTASTSPPAAPPGMRDVTPRANSQPRTTTGAAPANGNAPAKQ
jgi:hypothetical protein